MIIFLRWIGIKSLILSTVILACILNICVAAETSKHLAPSKKTHTSQKKKKVKHVIVSKKKKHPIKSVAKTHNKNKRKIVAKKKRAKPISRPNIVISKDKTPINLEISTSAGFVASIEKRLVEFVHKTVTTLRYSAYKLGGSHFDTSRGVYIVDCSNYVDHILKTIHPRAYSSLVNSSRSGKPTSDDYYHFFTKLSNKPQYYWNAVEDVEALRPGDILVFRKKNKFGNGLTGHVMIIMEKPIRDKNTFWVRIADSAPFRHSLDTRMPNVSGIGIGTFLLKVNPKTFQPAAYAWTANSPWKQVDFAMGRPVDLLS